MLANLSALMQIHHGVLDIVLFLMYIYNMLKEIINLVELEQFDFESLITQGHFALIPFLDARKNKIGHIVDFGTIFLGWDSISQEEKDWAFSISGAPGETNVFLGPDNLTQAHIATKFGLFKSVNQAVKNGHPRIPFSSGCHEVNLKFKKARGQFWVHNLL